MTKLFLCFYSKKITEEVAFVLTPKAMKWDDDTWIFDLSETFGYWQNQAFFLQKTPYDLITSSIDSLIASTDHCGVFSEHPWTGLLTLTHMRKRKLKGVLGFDSPFIEVIKKEWSLKDWIHQAKHLALYLNKTQNGINAKLKLLQASAARLGFSKVKDLCDATQFSMARRFGPDVARMWEWTLSHKFEGLEEFPWVSWLPARNPSCARDLDYPVWSWDNVSEVLKEDFDRLCRDESWDVRYRVLKILWSIQLDDFSTLDVEILFRNPHSLFKETSHHKTALLQAQYAFMSTFHQQRKKLIKESLDAQSIIGWKLEITKRLLANDPFKDLFSGFTIPSHAQAVLSLENKLPVPLQSFRLSQDWLAEDSFLQNSTVPPIQHEADQLYIALSKIRPIFLYKKPQPLGVHFNAASQKNCFFFLERASVKWWHEGNASNSHRDYYRYTDKNFKTYWVFKDHTESWYIHGLFA